jgi:hypothetical protein
VWNINNSNNTTWNYETETFTLLAYGTVSSLSCLSDDIIYCEEVIIPQTFVEIFDIPQVQMQVLAYKIDKE